MFIRWFVYRGDAEVLGFNRQNFTVVVTSIRCTDNKSTVIGEYDTAVLVVRLFCNQSHSFIFQSESIWAAMSFLQAQDVAVFCVAQVGHNFSFG